MKLPLLLSLSGPDSPHLLKYVSLLASLAPLSNAVNFNPIPSPDIDLSNLGRVGLAGDFDGISFYQFEGQNENGFSTNGSQSILSQFPNGQFTTLASSDAGIRDMCSFVRKDGTEAGVIVAGNFTSLGGVNSPGAAIFNPNTSAVTPLTGLSGQVSAVLCDQETDTVYFGGSLRGKNSTNAIAWVGESGWKDLAFRGFNGPVTSITKASNGHIIFGGSFTALGNATTPDEPDQQIINIAGADITGEPSAPTAGFDDPTSILCKAAGTDGPGSTWLLADNAAGFWDAQFGYGFEPTKLRLWNTYQDGRGTKTWRFTAQPLNGIMNFTYTDPATGQNASCSSECPLSDDASVPFQDFHFVNLVGMSRFRLDISEWYGNGAGLDGIELFGDDIFAYAINTFNEPTCAGLRTASNTTATGPWTVSPSLQSNSGYLSATAAESESASVEFLPDIKQSGNYSVNIYTPGCTQDNTCATRGRVSISGKMSSANPEFNTEVFQTNDFDKYDEIFFGYVEAGSSSFRPSVKLAAAPGQDFSTLSIVAQRVGFTLVSSTGGLNNIFEYNPTQDGVDAADFTTSAFDRAGVSLGTKSKVKVLETSGSTTFVGGNFSTTTFKNIFSIDGKDTKSLSGGGLDGEVSSMLVNGTVLYVGGSFTKTGDRKVSGLNHVAAYDTTKNEWKALGAGVDGIVSNIVPLVMNVTGNVPETVITLTGDFTSVLASGDDRALSVAGFAIWVPSQKNWLQNLHAATISIDGELSASVKIPGGGSLFAGSLSSSQLDASGAVTLTSGSTLGQLPVNIQPKSPSSTLSKRAVTSQDEAGILTGLFYESGGRNLTILGGHFTATGSNGTDINNLLFINGSNSDATTGIGPSLLSNSTIRALAVGGDILYAGGALTGNVNGQSVEGLVTYDLVTPTFATQLPPLDGDRVEINAITIRPESTDVWVAGTFTSAGARACPGVCVFTPTVPQWNRPGSNLGGVAHVMIWASPNSLIVGGALSVNGKDVSLATYDSKARLWSAGKGAAAIPGPVTALAQANSDSSELWVAGTAQDGGVFLMKFDGDKWDAVGGGLGRGSVIHGLQMLPLTNRHDSTTLVEDSQVLMVTGSIVLPGFGHASAVLYNGTTFQPYILTRSANAGGSLSRFFSQEQNFFTAPGGHLAVGFVVLIALAIALGITFLMVVGGVAAERIRRKREGYVPAPTSTYDKKSNMARIPPSQLFGSLGQGRTGVERQSTMI